MASSNNEQNASIKLVIKSANQKHDDFVVENFDSNWTIKQLKQHLKDNYPRNPDIESIRLIYSGKLLHDHCKLKEVLRQNSEVKAHILHLVQSSANLNRLNQSANRSNVSANSNADDNEIDLDNELTPNSSSISSSTESSTSSSNSSPIPSLNASHARSSNNIYASPNRFSQIQNDLNNLFQQQQQQRQDQANLTPKQKFNQIRDNYIRYYESCGIPIQSNSWYSTYVQHMALYNYMYSNYLQSLDQNYNETQLLDNRPTQVETSNDRSQEEVSASPPAPTTPPQPAPQAQPPPPQPQAQPQNRAPARAAGANADAADRDDDWLSLLHNVVSFLVLFSIIYYYSSMERFLVIFTIVLILILYHNGWLSLQRRQIRNVRINNNGNNQQADQRAPNNTDENNRNENENQQQAAAPPEPPANPSMFRLIATFIITFFTSLIPERPRVAAN